MIKRSTLSDLLSYAYNESDLHESDRIQRAIDGDPILKEEFNEVVSTIRILDEAKPEINPESIRRILEFAKS